MSLAWTLALVSALGVSGGPEHVSFLVMGKTTNHRQVPGGPMRLLNYHFFAEIFVREGGRVADASLTFPNGAVQGFEDEGYVLELHGGRYDDEKTLDRLYPNGVYRFLYETPAGVVHSRLLEVRGTGEGKSRIPDPPRITLVQEGREISSESVDPEKDLAVTWSEFRDGAPDANGIVDDLVFVVLGNCRGEKTVHSGRPFEGTPYLTFQTTEYVIPKEKLAPGEPHQMFVENAVVDTSRENGVVGLVTYAATTFLDFRTTGDPSGPTCPAEMPRIDQGQTDRPKEER